MKKAKFGSSATGEGCHGKRKHVEASSGPFDASRFVSSATQSLYLQIKDKVIHLERVVKLRDGEFVGFYDEIQRRNWLAVAQPRDHYHLDIVRQFYANGALSPEARADRYFFVNDIQIKCDKETINDFLGSPWKGGDTLCTHQRMLRDEEFDEDAI